MTRSIVLLITAVLSILLGFVAQYYLVTGGEGFNWPSAIYMGIVVPCANVCAMPTLMLVWVYSARIRNQKLGEMLFLLLAHLNVYMTQLVDYLGAQKEAGMTGIATALWCFAWVIFGQNATHYFLNN